MQRNSKITFHFAGFALFSCGMTCFLVLGEFAPLKSSIRQGLFHKLTAFSQYKSRREETLCKRQDKHEVAGLTRCYCACLSTASCLFYWPAVIYCIFEEVSRLFFHEQKPLSIKGFFCLLSLLKIYSNSFSRHFNTRLQTRLEVHDSIIAVYVIVNCFVFVLFFFSVFFSFSNIYRITKQRLHIIT